MAIVVVVYDEPSPFGTLLDPLLIIIIIIIIKSHINFVIFSCCCLGRLHLRARFLADDRLEVSHDGGERVRTDGRPDEVMRVAYICYPVPHCLIDRILQRSTPGLNRNHLSHACIDREHMSAYRDVPRVSKTKQNKTTINAGFAVKQN